MIAAARFCRRAAKPARTNSLAANGSSLLDPVICDRNVSLQSNGERHPAPEGVVDALALDEPWGSSLAHASIQVWSSSSGCAGWRRPGEPRSSVPRFLARCRRPWQPLQRLTGNLALARAACRSKNLRRACVMQPTSVTPGDQSALPAAESSQTRPASPVPRNARACSPARLSAKS